MNKEIEKVFTERGFTNIEQMATMFDYYKQEIERLQNIIKEVRESAKGKIKQYESYINDLKKGEFTKETVHRERQELIYRIREQEELLEILDKAGDKE